MGKIPIFSEKMGKNPEWVLLGNSSSPRICSEPHGPGANPSSLVSMDHGWCFNWERSLWKMTLLPSGSLDNPIFLPFFLLFFKWKQKNPSAGSEPSRDSQAHP